MKWTIAVSVLTVLAFQALPSRAALSTPAAAHVITDFEDFPDSIWVNPIKHGDIVIESNTKKISVDGVGVPSAPLKGKFLQIYNMEGTHVVTKITFPAQASGFSFDFQMRGFNGTYPTYICRYSNGTEKKISFIRQTGTAKCVGLSGTEATGVDIVLPAKLYLFFYLDNIVAL